MVHTGALGTFDDIYYDRSLKNNVSYNSYFLMNAVCKEWNSIRSSQIIDQKGPVRFDLRVSKITEERLMLSWWNLHTVK